MSKTHLDFFMQYLRNPKQVGAIAPSSAALAAAITRDISPADAPVIELGPGTGTVTRSILDRGIAPRDLTLIESNPDFATLLEREFPDVRVLCMNAAELATTELFSDRRAGAVVSGIPFLMLDHDEATAILSGVLHWMRPDAAIYQFTYGLRAPIPAPVLSRLGLGIARVGGTYRNLPPASVYRLTRLGATQRTRAQLRASATSATGTASAA